MTAQKKQEFTLRISQANSTQLIVILYEMLLEYLEVAREFHRQDNKKEFRTSVQNARKCLDELKASLNHEYELADTLHKLYMYVSEETMKAFVHAELEHIDNAAGVIKELHEAYLEVSIQNTSKPIMENSQEVYAGLTYGKNNLVENLNNAGENRGFLV